MKTPKYQRILLKLSGEALAGEKGFGLDQKVVNAVARQIQEVVELGTQVAIVVGGDSHITWNSMFIHFRTSQRP